MTSQPTIVTRAQWGADRVTAQGRAGYRPSSMAFVHHTDTGNDYTAAEAPAIVRGIYAYHTQTLGWNDIGYNFLIDRFGTIYEGRYGGVGKGVIGAQVLGFNTGSTGIAMIGTFMSVAPPPAAMSALETLLAWKLSLSHLNPLATATMTCGVTQKFKAGASVTLPVIAGHRDANYTDCPGDALYAPAAGDPPCRRGHRPAQDLRPLASTEAFNPKRAGAPNSVSVSATLSQTATWQVAVRNPDSNVVRSYNGSGTQVAATWDGVLPRGARPRWLLHAGCHGLKQRWRRPPRHSAGRRPDGTADDQRPARRCGEPQRRWYRGPDEALSTWSHGRVRPKWASPMPPASVCAARSGRWLQPALTPRPGTAGFQAARA